MTFFFLFAEQITEVSTGAAWGLYGFLLLIGLNRQLPYEERASLTRLPSDLLLLIWSWLEEYCYPPSVPHWAGASPPDPSWHPKIRTYLKRVFCAPRKVLTQAMLERPEL